MGDTQATPRVQDAIDYLVRHWNDPNDGEPPPDAGWRGAGLPVEPACQQSTFTIMKGLVSLGLAHEKIGGIDWQADFETVLVAQHNPDGSWPQSFYSDAELTLSTTWALLTLQKAVAAAPDTTPPTAFDLVSPPDGSSTTNTSPTFTWNPSSDPESGIAKYQLWIDGSLNQDNIPPTSTSATPASPLSLGPHTWYVKAFNNVGLSTNSTSTWTVTITVIPTGFNTLWLIFTAISGMLAGGYLLLRRNRRFARAVP